MIWTRLYDPGRTPAHWTQMVHERQCVVFVCDARTRAPRDADGRSFCAADGTETGPCAALCDDAADAERFACDVVSRHPGLCCEIYDYEGKSRPPLKTIYDPGVRHKYVGLAHARRQSLAGAALVCTGTTLIVVDISRGLAWIWGYVLGLKCLLLGGTFLILGLLEWREHRNERLG